jgi:hypothetical protein
LQIVQTPKGKLIAALVLSVALGLSSVARAQVNPDVASCGKDIETALGNYVNGLLVAVSACSLNNLKTTNQLNCATDSSTARAIQSANAKLLSQIKSCSAAAEQALCPLGAKTIGALYNTLTSSSGSFYTQLTDLNSALFTKAFNGCTRPTTKVSTLSQTCAQRIAQATNTVMQDVQQCLFDCEVGNLSSPGVACVDLTTGAPSKAKVASCISNALGNLTAALQSRCTPANLAELGCPQGATSLADLNSALSVAATGINESLNLGVYHSSCRSSPPPPGPTPSPSAGVLNPSGTQKIVACGDVLDSSFFGSDTTFVFTVALDCSLDTTGTNGIVVSASNVTIDGGKLNITGPGKTRFRTGTGILVAPGATNVTLQNFRNIQAFAVGIGDSGNNAGLNIHGLSVHRNVAAGIRLSTPGLTLQNITADRNTIGFDLSGDDITLQTCTARGSTPAPGIGLRLTALDANANGRAVTVQQSTIEANMVGFLLQGGAHDLEQNDINTSIGDGVQIAGTGAILNSNSIKQNGGNGINLTGTGNKITNNRCDQNTLSGMLIAGTGNIITGNGAGSLTSNGNLQYGYLVTAASNILRNNFAQANALAGFEIQAGTTKFKSNSAQSNAGPGFEFTVGGSGLESNDGESNGNHQFIIAPGNTDLTNNRANSVTFSFTSAGGTF